MNEADLSNSAFRLLGETGERRTLCLIEHDHPAWFVERGCVDVFQVATDVGGAMGVREHLFSVDGGQLLIFPVDGSSAGEVLAAVAGPDTVYRVISRDKLLAVLDAPALRTEVVTLFHALLARIAGGFKLVPPAGHLVARAGRRYVGGEHGCVLVADQQGMWFDRVHGQVAYCDVPFPHSDGPLPIPLHTWVTLAPHGELRVRGTDVPPGDVTGAAMLALVDGLFTLRLTLAVRQKRKNEADELDRLQLVRQINDRAMADALGQFVSLFEQHGTDGGYVDGGDQILRACKIIGARIGVDFQPAPIMHGGAPSRSPVQDIARASGVRLRAVALKGDWWRRDNGPLLVFDQTAHRPYALLPARRSGYRKIDPASGVVEPVTAEFAQTLAPFACFFYAGLPAKKLAARDILRFSGRGLGPDIATVAAIAVASALLGMAVPLAGGHLFDSVIPAADQGQMAQIVAVLFVVSLVGLMFELTRSLAMLRIEGKAGSDLQAAVWDRVLSLPVPFFRAYSVGDLAMRINGINDIRQMLSGTVVTSVVGAVFSVLNVLLLFYYSVSLALVASALLAGALCFNVVIGYFGARMMCAMVDMNGKVTGLVIEYLSGIAKLRIAGAELRAFTNWAACFAEQKKLALAAGRLFNFCAAANAAFPLASNAMMFAWIGGAAVLPGYDHLSTGDVIALTWAWSVSFGAMLSLVRGGMDMLSAVALYERTRPILETVPEVDRRKPPVGTLRGAIELSNISFSYTPGAPPVLDDVSISIRPGEFVALVGASGSGKSTLLRLLLGFERPTYGGVYYDGCNLDEIDVVALRRQLGVVLQGGRLMTGDIYSNVVGSTSLSLADVREALRACGLDEEIDAMPMGVHTAVSDGGTTLSGGQRQRVLIARAIIHKPQVIFFDEATSALDNRSQAVVKASMDRLKATRVVIAHRLSTIMNADRIYVLDKGKLVQCGSYEQLIRQEGLFSELAKRQIA